MLHTVWIVSQCVSVSRTPGKRFIALIANGFVSIPDFLFIPKVDDKPARVSMRAGLFHFPREIPRLFPTLTQSAISERRN